MGLIPGLGRFPGGGNGNPLRYSCLENSMDGFSSCGGILELRRGSQPSPWVGPGMENPMDRGSWQVKVLVVTKKWGGRREEGSDVYPVGPHEKPHTGAAARENPRDPPLHREMMAFFSCMAWRAITSPLSKLHRRLDSLLVTQWTPRHTRRDSRGERSLFLPLEARPDSSGVSDM